ncbi:MAG: serine/threonine-protein kinase [Cyanobacteria bacterium J06600_6]
MTLVREKSNYKILDLVGRGQFGRVYAAIERQSGMLVALKELNIKQLSTSNFLRELTFLVTLDHFNIVSCRALEHQQNKRYLVMDYCEGGTLRDLINRVPKMGLTRSLQLIIDVLQGLEFAHARGIIHRDIKPENILLKSSDRGYSAHIADFGIAQLSQQSADRDVLSNTGSPAYMAPEQFYGDYSYNCDLYGLGIILYELVVGERPFLGMPKDLLPAHLSRPPIIPSNLPSILRRAIAQSLRKFPQYRFQSAAEMRHALELVLEVIEADAQLEMPIQAKSGFPVLNADTSFTYTGQILDLAVSQGQVYLNLNNDSIVRRDLDAERSPEALELEKTVFNQPIHSLQHSLQVSTTGCLVATRTSLYYQSQIAGVDTDFLPIATFASEKAIATVDPQGSWLAVAEQTQSETEQSKTKEKLNIYKLPQGQLKRSLVNSPVFDHLIALDSSYAIGLRREDRNTKFQLFNRRGNWLANFSVQIKLATVAHNPLFPHRLLATEVDNSHAVILIKLKKFSLQRVSLEIKPVLVTDCPVGYLVSDRQGKIIVLNSDGELIHSCQISLPPEFELTAIAVDQTRLLIASTDSTHSQLQIFSWNAVIHAW